MTTNIFEPAGVDIVISGHSHFYQHNLVHNMHHLVVGTSGAPQYVPTTASYTIRSVQDYNYALFDVTPTTLRITVYNSTDALLDTLQFTKPPTSMVERREGVIDYALTQNYPNPFNGQTTISFSIPHSTHTTLKIVNTLGQEIASLVSNILNPGTYSTEWNASNAASGVYYYRLQSGEFTQTKKLILMK